MLLGRQTVSPTGYTIRAHVGHCFGTLRESADRFFCRCGVSRPGCAADGRSWDDPGNEHSELGYPCKIHLENIVPGQCNRGTIAGQVNLMRLPEGVDPAPSPSPSPSLSPSAVVGDGGEGSHSAPCRTGFAATAQRRGSGMQLPSSPRLRLWLGLLLFVIAIGGAGLATCAKQLGL